MSDWSGIPKYEENSDGDLWLSNFLSSFNTSTPATEHKEIESKKPKAANKTIKMYQHYKTKEDKSKES